MIFMKIMMIEFRNQQLDNIMVKIFILTNSTKFKIVRIPIIK